MTNSSTSGQPEMAPKSPTSKSKQKQDRNDIIGRTHLQLPSLSGLEQIPLVPPSGDQQGISTTPDGSKNIGRLPFATLPTSEAHLSYTSEKSGGNAINPRLFSTNAILQKRTPKRSIRLLELLALLLLLGLLAFGIGAYLSLHTVKPEHSTPSLSMQVTQNHREKASTLDSRNFQVRASPVIMIQSNDTKV